MLPPVAITLMTSAPCSTSSPVRRVTPGTPLATPPRKWQCPLGIVTGRPHTSRRGPGMARALIALRSSSVVRCRPPRSRSTVTPARRASRALMAPRRPTATSPSFWMSSNGTALALKVMWTWESTMPGMMVAPG